MVIHFYIKYKTTYGQALGILINNLNKPNTEIQLEYLNDEYWYGNLDTSDLSKRETIDYHYILKETGKADKGDHAQNRSLNIKKIDEKEINVLDDWQDAALEKTVFNTRPFLNVFGQPKTKLKESTVKNPSHIFEVEATHLPDNIVLLQLPPYAPELNSMENV